VADETHKASAAAQEAALKNLAASNLPHEVVGKNVMIEFRIQDLVNRVGGIMVAGHCSGCIGCTGCKN